MIVFVCIDQIIVVW